MGDRYYIVPMLNGYSEVFHVDSPAVNGIARLVQDDLENSYDACFETACSFKP